jgi:hypothetical protein
LPAAPVEYDAQFIEQYSNILRLYLNQLNSILGQLNTSAVLPPTTNYTVATLPSAATSGAGARTFVTNALTPTFGSTVAGGGAVFTPVYSDGTNWKVG